MGYCHAYQSKPLYLNRKGGVILQQIQQVRACQLESYRLDYRLTSFEEMFVLVCDSPPELWEKELPQQWCGHNSESQSLGPMPTLSVQRLLDTSEEFKMGKTYEVIFICPGASRRLLLPSSICLYSENNIFLIFPSCFGFSGFLS
jgi:hypothetical protein